MKQKYISVRMGDQEVAIPYSKKYQLEPTQINKISPLANPKNKYIDGFINYKGKIVDVLNLSEKYGESSKKFDGLLFVYTEEKSVAIEFEGFYKEKFDIKEEQILQLENII